MREQGVVIEIHEGIASVQIDKSRACAHCKAGCMEQGGSMISQAENLAGAQVGDTVRLEFDHRAALKAALIVFGLPLLALLLGAVLAAVVADQTGYQGRSELLSIGFGAILFLLTFFPIRAYDRHIKKSGSYNVAVVQILEKDEQ